MYRAFFKRFFDFFGALFLIILTSPVMVVLYLLIKFSLKFHRFLRNRAQDLMKKSLKFTNLKRCRKSAIKMEIYFPMKSA